MKRTYRFDKSFGPVASFSGIIIFVVGLTVTYYDLSGLILVILGLLLDSQIQVQPSMQLIKE